MFDKNIVNLEASQIGDLFTAQKSSSGALSPSVPNPTLSAADIESLRERSAVLSRQSSEIIKGEWLRALEAWGFTAVYCEMYSSRLAMNMITIDDGASLEESHCMELKIKIGHRKDVRQAAAVARRAADTLLMEFTGGENGRRSPTISRTSSIIYGDDESPDSPYVSNLSSSPTAAASSFNLFNFRSDDYSTLTVRDRNNSIGVLWKSASGGCRTITEFFAKVCGLRQKMKFPKSFDRAFLDNKPMPLHDQDGVYSLVVLRIPDLENEEGSTVGTITNRLVVMFSSKHKRLFTYHRCDRDPLERMANDWDSGVFEKANVFQVVDAINRCYLLTFRHGLKQLQARSDELEDEQDMVSMVEGLTHVQKKAAVYKRCLSAGRQALEELKELRGLEDYIPLICETAQSFESMMDEVAENAVGTINMQMALDGFLSSRNTQVFTYISVVCQPITVATGWYGMNYVNMPELEFEDGYFVFAGITLSLALLLVLWIRFRSMFN